MVVGIPGNQLGGGQKWFWTMVLNIGVGVRSDRGDGSDDDGSDDDGSDDDGSDDRCRAIATLGGFCSRWRQIVQFEF